MWCGRYVGYGTQLETGVAQRHKAISLFLFLVTSSVYVRCCCCVEVVVAVRVVVVAVTAVLFFLFFCLFILLFLSSPADAENPTL